MSKEALFKRLAKNAEAMGKKGLIDNAKMDARNAAFEKLLRKEAGYDQLSIEWYKKMLREESAKLWENQQPKIDISPRSYSRAQDDRIKSQYETMKSGGQYNPNLRNKAENKLLGTDYLVGDKQDNPKIAPVYGYQFGAPYLAADYGDITLNLDPKVKDQMTYSFGDSLDDKRLGRYGFADWTAVESPDIVKDFLKGTKGEQRHKIAENKMYDMFDKIKTMRDINNGKVDPQNLSDAVDNSLVYYIENQYHGGLPFNMVQPGGTLRYRESDIPTLLWEFDANSMDELAEKTGFKLEPKE